MNSDALRELLLGDDLIESLSWYIAKQVWDEWHGPMAKLPEGHNGTVRDLQRFIDDWLRERAVTLATQPAKPGSERASAVAIKLDQMARRTTILAMELAYKCLKSFTIQSTHPDAARVRDICYTLLGVKYHRAEPDESGEWMGKPAALAATPTPATREDEDERRRISKRAFDERIAKNPAAPAGKPEGSEK